MRSALLDASRRRIARVGVVAVVCVVGSSLSLGAAAALAAGEPHPPAQIPSFGSFTNPNGIAVDESTGDVYVADIGTNAVYRFDASGNPVPFASLLGSNELTGATTASKSFMFPSAANGTPAAIAVDNSKDPSDQSAGDLYVMDAGHNVIDKFNAQGELLDQIAEGELRGHPREPFAGKLIGIGVDAKGDLRVATSEQGYVFDNAVANNFVFNPPNLGTLQSGKYGVAVNPTDDEYLPGQCSCITKFGGNGEPLGMVDNPTSPDVAVAVDPSTGHLYTDDQTSVTEWDTGGMNGVATAIGSGAAVSKFGSFSGSTGQGGIAVNGTSGRIYVSNAADHKVYMFETVVPAVAVIAAANLTETSAELKGTVDPRGIPVISCQFEYEVSPPGTLGLTTPLANYAHDAPCDLTATQIGVGTAPVSVTADVGGLEPGLLYHFRLTAANANGTSASSGLFATVGRGFGVKPGGFEVSFVNKDGTPDTQAGSHPYKMLTNIEFNTHVIPRETTADSRYSIQPEGNVKDIITDLPPGLVGDPNATPVKCTLAQLQGKAGENGGGGHCPAESKVGQLEVEFAPYTEVPINEPVYNMVAPRGVAVQIGAQFIIPDSFINAGVVAGGDYPVQAGSFDISTIEPIISTRLTVFGVVGKNEIGESGITELSSDTRKPFLTLPTGCTGPLRSTIMVDSYQNQGHYVETSTFTRDAAGNPVGLTGCSQLKFPPTISAAPDTTNASTSSGLTVGVHVSQKAALNPTGFAESALRDTTVTLPEGMMLNPAGADGLQSCSSDTGSLPSDALGSPGDQIGYKGMEELNPDYEPGVKWSTFTSEKPSPLDPGANFCPDGSKIGTVKIKTPLLEHELEGAVYLAAQNANPFGSLVAMYLVAEDPVSGTFLKLAGEVELTETGQIVTTFKNTPDLPFEDLELHFFGGERAPLSTPSRCGTYTTKAVFTPWDGNGPVTSTSSFVIDHGPGGGPCPGASLPFNPSLAAGATSNQAGGLTPFTMTMSREDGQQNMQAITLKMPPGLSGLLTGVELCGEAQANEGTCGANSMIGETIVSVGIGNDPFSVKGGKVYLTGPYKGAPFGLSIVNPAKAGPYDLENTPAKHPACDCLVVRAKIEVDPTTADLTVTSDNEGPYKIPTMIEGIPLQIKHVNVTINRPGFMFNPTDCNPLNITGAIDSTEGASSTVNVPFQATNCARLSFKPQFEVSTSGKTSRLEGASLHVKLVYPKLPFGSQANIRSVKVDLPRQLPSNLEALKHACIDTTFNANPAACPAESRVGNAMATTPLIPVPLSGPAYFVSHGGAKFPELIVVLQGYGVTVDLHGETFIKNGITSSTFHTIPDVPVGTFELNLPQRPKYAALAAPGGLCNVTKIALVKRKIKVRGKNGKSHTVTRKVKKAIAAGLIMPTAFNAQNGAVIHQNTPIEVTGCAKSKKARNKRAHTKKKK